MFSFGDDISALDSYAWFTNNAQDKGDLYAHRVAQKKPNPWGLYDMHGNVWEWCQDWMDTGYYDDSPLENPQGRVNELKLRIYRGGAWRYNARNHRSANRAGNAPSVQKDVVGFRVVRELNAVELSALSKSTGMAKRGEDRPDTKAVPKVGVRPQTGPLQLSEKELPAEVQKALHEAKGDVQKSGGCIVAGRIPRWQRKSGRQGRDRDYSTTRSTGESDL